MKTRLVKVTAASVEAINEAAEIIKSGGLVAFPTETVYGLGADGFNEEACRKLYEVKGRPSNKPFTLMVDSSEAIEDIAVVTPTARRLIEEFLPGPLTLILQNRGDPSRTVGIRIPDNAAALALIRAAGCPIAAPSANPSNEPPPTTAQEVLAKFDGKIPLILDGGACQFGISSTIVDLSKDVPCILRKGAVAFDGFY